MAARHYKHRLILFLLLLVSGSSFAQRCGVPPLFASGFEDVAFYTYNDPDISGPTGDGRNFTRVSTMGLDWLDLTITLNLSTDEMRARLADANDELFGLRYATGNEVLRLWFDYGLTQRTTHEGTNDGMEFIGNLGFTAEYDGGYYVAHGLYMFDEWAQALSLALECPENLTVTTQSGASTTYKHPWVGSFLVRPIP